MHRRLALLGPPGSGKGTAASRLQEQFGLTHLSSGTALRAEVERRTDLGRQAKAFLERGDLVPDPLVIEFMAQWLTPEQIRQGFLLDGFPRTLPQGQALDRWLERHQAGLDRVLFFDCREAVSLERITGRRVCSQCGRNYHLPGRPPRVQGQCDACSGALVQRVDDTEPVLRQRLARHAERTLPLVDFYRRQGKLAVVDANQSSGQILAAAALVLSA